MPTIERIVQCKSCSGSGVYVGMCERDGAAVVCHVCEGTGKCNYKFEYQEFTGRKKREDVTRVYKQGYGFVIAPAKISFSRNGGIDMEKEGVSYDDFLRGEMPQHIKKLACPMLADQSACNKIKGFADECDRLHGSCLLGTLISQCNNQINRLGCWQRFESETVTD